MDFLDPKKRRAYHIRLYVGYVLVAIVIGLATYIIGQAVSGYGLDVKTGQIVQNGLLFVDSKPGGAEIFLNGQDQNSTSPARLVLPAGNYTLKLTKAGYHDWSRKFTLGEQSVARYQYPFLFPDNPRISSYPKTYASQPPLITQSPSQKWLLIEDPAASSAVPTFDQYDTTTLDKATPAVTSVAMPAGLLTNYSAGSVLTEVEWSTDNNNLLLRHDFSGGSEYIVFNRDTPSKSFNVNTTFGVTPDGVKLYNKGVDKLYIYDKSAATLSLADTGAKSVAAPFLRHVLAFQPYGKNLVNYVTDNNEPSGTVAAKIWDSGKTYSLNEFTGGGTDLINAAQFQGHFYYADGSDKSGRIFIFKDPEDTAKDPSIGKASPELALSITGADKLKFSDNARFIGSEAGQDFAIYDMETQTSYQYTLADPLAAEMHWMDGHRFIGQSGGNIFIMDYDGLNKHSIAPTLLPAGGYFSADYNHLLTITPSDDKTSFVLRDIDMRAGKDLPKKP